MLDAMCMMLCGFVHARVDLLCTELGMTFLYADWPHGACMHAHTGHRGPRPAWQLTEAEDPAFENAHKCGTSQVIPHTSHKFALLTRTVKG